MALQERDVLQHELEVKQRIILPVVDLACIQKQGAISPGTAREITPSPAPSPSQQIVTPKTGGSPRARRWRFWDRPGSSSGSS
jgi:hypothetical protein